MTGEYVFSFHFQDKVTYKSTRGGRSDQKGQFTGITVFLFAGSVEVWNNAICRFQEEVTLMAKFSSLLKKVLVVALVLSLALTFAVSSVSAADKPEYKWKFAQANVRPTQAKSMKLFCDLVGVYTDGRMEIEFFENAILGNEQETFHAVQDGSIEIGNLPPYVNLVPGGMFNWMPWTISSWDEAVIAFGQPDGILYKVLEKAYNEVGMHILYTNSQGPYGLGNNVRPIKKPEDLKNLKMRVSSSLGCVMGLVNMGKGTGMTVETVAWSELYNALGRNVVDGCWSMWPSLIEERHYEVLDYYTSLDWMWDANQIAVNKEAWDALPDDLKEAVTKAAMQAEIHQYELSRRAVRKMQEQLASEESFNIYYPTSEEREMFREKADMLSVWEELCKPWLEKHYPGQNMTEKILDELDRIHEQVKGSN